MRYERSSPWVQGEKRAEPGDEALDALLADSHHDAWLLAEHFLASGRRDLAARLAERTDEKAIGPLASYVEASSASQTASQSGAERADALAAALRALGAGEYEDALEQLERVRAVPGRVSVFGVRAANLAGNVLLALDRSSESIEAWLEGGEEALEIGWWYEANEFLVKAVQAALAAQSLDLLARGAEGIRALREVYGEALYLASAVHNLGSIAHWRGDLPGALRHLNEAVSLFESLQLDADAVEVRSERSWILAQTGDFRAALDEQRRLARYFEDRPRDTAWASNQVHLGVDPPRPGRRGRCPRCAHAGARALSEAG